MRQIVDGIIMGGGSGVLIIFWFGGADFELLSSVSMDMFDIEVILLELDFVSIEFISLLEAKKSPSDEDDELPGFVGSVK